MPLRVVRRKDTGTLWIVGTVRAANTKTGRRVRQAAGTADIQLAQEAAAQIEAEIHRTAWHGERRGVKTFAEAATSYLDHAARSWGTQHLIKRLALHFGSATTLGQITQERVDWARKTLFQPATAPATVRRGLIVPLTAVLTHAARRGWCDVPHFDAPQAGPGRTAFLTPPDVARLLDVSDDRLRPLWIFLICTGCRTGEAMKLDWSQVDLTAARVLLWEGETKSGKRRVVKLPPAAVVALAGLSGRDGPVFRNRRGQAYQPSERAGAGQLRKPWARICRAAGIEGVTPHALRHSWASWHYAVHKDLLLLKQDGGWSSVVLVERYAHLLPAGHEDGIKVAWGIGGAALAAITA